MTTMGFNNLNDFIDNIIYQMSQANNFNITAKDVSIKKENVSSKKIDEMNIYKSNKSKKKRKEVISPDNIGKYIESYIKNNPQIFTSYLKDHLKINFRPRKTDLGDTRYSLALYLDDKLISESTLCLNIF